jgi:hypothetical protein
MPGAYPRLYESIDRIARNKSLEIAMTRDLP